MTLPPAEICKFHKRNQGRRSAGKPCFRRSKRPSEIERRRGENDKLRLAKARKYHNIPGQNSVPPYTGTELRHCGHSQMSILERQEKTLLRIPASGFVGDRQPSLFCMHRLTPWVGPASEISGFCTSLRNEVGTAHEHNRSPGARVTAAAGRYALPPSPTRTPESCSGG